MQIWPFSPKLSILNLNFPSIYSVWILFHKDLHFPYWFTVTCQVEALSLPRYRCYKNRWYEDWLGISSAYKHYAKKIYMKCELLELLHKMSMHFKCSSHGLGIIKRNEEDKSHTFHLAILKTPKHLRSWIMYIIQWGGKFRVLESLSSIRLEA